MLCNIPGSIQNNFFSHHNVAPSTTPQRSHIEPGKRINLLVTSHSMTTPRKSLPEMLKRWKSYEKRKKKRFKVLLYIGPKCSNIHQTSNGWGNNVPHTISTKTSKISLWRDLWIFEVYFRSALRAAKPLLVIINENNADICLPKAYLGMSKCF